MPRLTKRTPQYSLSRSDRARRIFCQKCGGLIMTDEDWEDAEEEDHGRCICDADGQDQASHHLDPEDS